MGNQYKTTPIDSDKSHEVCEYVKYNISFKILCCVMCDKIQRVSNCEVVVVVWFKCTGKSIYLL